MMHWLTRAGGLVAIALSVLPGRAMAELSTASAQSEMAARYDRAARLMFVPAIASVRNEAVVPHWINGEDRFWYSKQTKSGVDFLVVDAATGAARTAFDAPGIARALSPLLKTVVGPDNLPFNAFNFSADGSKVTFNVGASRYSCVIATSSCGAVPAAAEPNMVLSPDGTRAVFVRGGNLFVHDIATKADRQLTTDGSGDKGWGITPEPSDYHAIGRAKSHAARPPFWTIWSPDSRRFITSYTDLSFVEPYPFVEYVPDDGSLRPKAYNIRLALPGERQAQTSFYVLDVATGSRTKLNLDSSKMQVSELASRSGEWSDDGRYYRLFAPWADVHGASLYEIDVHAGTVRQVIKEQGTYPALLNAGGYGAPNTAIIRRGKQVIWSSQRDGWPHLYLYDLTTGRQIRQLTKGRWVVRELLRADDKLGRVFFVGSGRDDANPYHRSVYSIGYDGRGLRRLTPEQGDRPIGNPRSAGPGFDGARPYDPISPSGRYLVYGTSTVSQPTVTVLRRIADGALIREVERADVSQLLNAGYRPPTEFTAKAADGRTNLYGVIYRPSDYDPSRRYPVLLAQYNSPIVTVTPRNYGGAYSLPLDNATPAADAELGMIVVMVDPRGTPFRGSAFSNPSRGFIADMGLSDQVAAIRQLGRRDPSMDLSRVGIAGASFGGWTAVRALIEHNDLFKVAVAWASPGAFHNMYEAVGLTAPMGAPVYEGGSALRPSPKDAPKNWAAMNSIAQVGRMKGRLLMGTGGLDENVLPGSQLQFLEAAAKAQKDVEQIFLPSATHGPIPPLFPYALKRTWDFYIRTLRSETPPTDYNFPKGTMLE